MSNTTTNEYVPFRCAPPCGRLLVKYVDSIDCTFEIKCHHMHCRNMNYHWGGVLVHPADLVEFRCTAIDEKRTIKLGTEIVCNKLLARVLPGTILEIKCPRCGSIVTSEHITREPK